jgi:hypothetical protein
MKKLIIAGTFLLTASVSALADQSQEEKIAQLEKTIEAQRRTISRAEKMVADLKKQLAEKEKENRRLLALCRKAGIETDVKQNDDEQSGIASKFEPPLSIGQIAYLGGNNDITIEQIIDANNMIVRFTLEPDVRGVPSGRILSHGYSKTVWIAGINTSGLVDGIGWKTDKPLKVTGTKSDGINTLYVLEPFISQEQK